MAALRQSFVQLLPVSGCRDDNRRVIFFQRLTDEACQNIHEHLFGLIDLHEVLACRHFSPESIRPLYMSHGHNQSSRSPRWCARCCLRPPLYHATSDKGRKVEATESPPSETAPSVNKWRTTAQTRGKNLLASVSTMM